MTKQKLDEITILETGFYIKSPLKPIEVLGGKKSSIFYTDKTPFEDKLKEAVEKEESVYNGYLRISWKMLPTRDGELYKESVLLLRYKFPNQSIKNF
jgi:hypothetical protein